MIINVTGVSWMFIMHTIRREYIDTGLQFQKVFGCSWHIVIFRMENKQIFQHLK